MNKKLLLIISLFLIFILFLIPKKPITGEIEKVTSTQKATIFTLKNLDLTFIATKPLQLEESQSVQITGKADETNKSIVFVDKIKVKK